MFVCPLGKSLDVIAELREKGRIKDPTKRKRKKTLAQMQAGLLKKVRQVGRWSGISGCTLNIQK